MDKKFAIFDMDGTIVDSMSYWKNILNEYITTNNLNINNIYNSLPNETIVYTLEELFDYCINTLYLPFTRKEFLRELDKLMEKHYLNDVQLKLGVENYLIKLKNKSVNMCVASSTDENLIDLCLTKLNIKKYFDFFISCRAIGKGKKYPDIYLQCAKKYNVDNNNIAVYEDSLQAVKTANSASFYTIGVFDENSKEFIEDIKQISNEFITDFREE